MAASKRNGKVELMRFLMCICVILYHLNGFFSQTSPPQAFGFFTMAAQGCIAVEFFFVLSGFFLAKSAEAAYQRKAASAWKDSAAFLYKKIATIFPYQALAFFGVFAMTCVLKHWEASEIWTNAFKGLPDLFLLSMSGIPYLKINGVDWYLSAMLIAFVFIYPICRKWYPAAAKIAAPVISFLLLIFLYLNNDGHVLTIVHRFYGPVKAGLLRAVAELLLGVVCYEVSKRIQRHTLPKCVRVLLTGLEFGLFAVLMLFVFSPWASSLQFVFLFVIAVLLTLTLSGVTYGNERFSKSWIYFLGKYSLSVYICQYIPMDFAEVYLKTAPRTVFVLFTIAGALLFGWLIMRLGEKLQNKMLRALQPKTKASNNNDIKEASVR